MLGILEKGPFIGENSCFSVGDSIGERFAWPKMSISSKEVSSVSSQEKRTNTGLSELEEELIELKKETAFFRVEGFYS